MNRDNKAREKVRDLLMEEARTREELAEIMGKHKATISSHMHALRLDGYTINEVGRDPATVCRGYGPMRYSIDSRPPAPKVGTFSLSALWGNSKEMTQ